MDSVKATLQSYYDHANTQEYDRVVLVIGDESVGKSTFILCSSILWQDIRGKDVTTQQLLDQVVWDSRGRFKRQILNLESRSVIPVMDAARVLHKKESMHGEQVDLQKGMLDSRFKENLIFLGYQAYDDIPTFLQKRRAAGAFVIPRRGRVKAFNRIGLDHKWDTESWGDPIFTERFPSLEGTELWEEYKRRDHERKEQRLITKEDKSAEDIEWETKARVALRAVKPWENERGLSYDEAAEIVDYSKTWVNDRVKDWRRGRLEIDLTADIPESQPGAEAD